MEMTVRANILPRPVFTGRDLLNLTNDDRRRALAFMDTFRISEEDVVAFEQAAGLPHWDVATPELIYNIVTFNKYGLGRRSPAVVQLVHYYWEGAAHLLLDTRNVMRADHLVSTHIMAHLSSRLALHFVFGGGLGVYTLSARGVLTYIGSVSAFKRVIGPAHLALLEEIVLTERARRSSGHYYPEKVNKLVDTRIGLAALPAGHANIPGWNGRPAGTLSNWAPKTLSDDLHDTEDLFPATDTSEIKDP